MSNMSELHIEVINRLEEGWVCSEIAKDMEIPIDWVEDIMNDAYAEAPEDYDDSMDGDHESALASVGWGTDEDYGYYGDDDY